jgi:hypothetical protein
MNELMTIESAAASYRTARDKLRMLATHANTALEDVKRSHLPALRDALTAVAEREAKLREAVQASPEELWRRSKTRTIHGVKVGWAKQRGRVEFDDETKVVERIRKLLPKDQAELLIRVREAVHKPAVYDLTGADLKRLGISISDDCDTVLVKDLASELDRAIEALLAQAAAVDGE